MIEEPIKEVVVEENKTEIATKTNLVVKAAQRLSYETRPITANGDILGTTLKINSNGETEKIEIRFMKRNKQIRVKTTGVDNVVSEVYVPLTDNQEIPPYTQMNKILKQVAEDKHINNVEDLIIEV